MAVSDMEMFEAQEHIAALEAEAERLRSTLAAKERVQRANEDEMSADNERLRAVAEAAREVNTALEDVPWSVFSVALCRHLDAMDDALSALDKEVEGE